MSKYRRVPLDELIVDERYQRPIETGRVERIAEHFDERLVGTLEVSRHNGKCAVFDGQHRLEALRLRGLPDAPCLVHDDLTPEAEARLFVVLQQARKRVHPVDRFRAQVFSGDARAVDINSAVERAGFRIAHDGPDAGEHRGIRAVVSLERIHRRSGAEGLLHTLKIVDELWGGDRKSTDGAFLEGVEEFFATYGDRIDTEESHRLRAESPTVMIRRSLGNGGGGTQLRFQILAELRKVAGVRGRPAQRKAAA